VLRFAFCILHFAFCICFVLLAAVLPAWRSFLAWRPVLPAGTSIAVAGRSAASFATLPRRTGLAGTAASLLGRSLASCRLALVAQQHLARQLDPVVLVDGDHLDHQLIADLAHVLDLADVLVVQLADVAQALAARQDLQEGPEVLDRGDLPLV